ncbi:mitochondrial glyco protein [Polyporus arcularius HHB13444]|uniref:Mitochondrial glyco protein n=1 Tax=Polyporus arcularius HHB13444 TaxID=1314778 RepID=A0A5C3NVC4_9APHY|nr:mitochondrial glyco protein [Polyporus arcularius HHB13444]
MSALRALRQLTASSSRSLAARAAPRAVTRSALAARVAPVSASRAFSVSARRLGEGASDAALSQRLAEELKYEKEATPAEEPEFLTTFKKNSPWTIQDTPGMDEVALVRKFGNEEIRLIFSIADIQNEQEPEFEEGEEGVEDGAEDAEASLPPYPLRCSFSFTKPSTPGALTIDAMCQDGTFVIDNISYYSDAKVGTDLTVEADWKRRGYYLGPQFDTLDISLQDEFDKFLAERGIDSTLAFWVPQYAEYKEQKEYVSWLKNVRDFVDA